MVEKLNSGLGCKDDDHFINEHSLAIRKDPAGGGCLPFLGGLKKRLLQRKCYNLYPVDLKTKVAIAQKV